MIWICNAQRIRGNWRTVKRHSNAITTGSTDPHDVTHALAVKPLHVCVAHVTGWETNWEQRLHHWSWLTWFTHIMKKLITQNMWMTLHHERTSWSRTFVGHDCEFDLHRSCEKERWVWIQWHVTSITGGCNKTQTTRSHTQHDGIYSKLIVTLPHFEVMNKKNE